MSEAMERLVKYRALVGPVALVAIFLVAVRWSPFEPHRPPTVAAPGDETTVTAGAGWADEDWAIFQSKVRWALEERLDTLPLGRAMAEMGRSFVGAAYVPGTLEVKGPERLVINFRGLDCVTFVENAWALSSFVRVVGGALGLDVIRSLTNRALTEQRYESLLRSVRYQDGNIDGYPSRLHYFTDWVGDNAARGLVRDISRELGGTLDTEPIDFMSTHTESYRQLGDPSFVTLVRQTEQRLTDTGRYFVSQDRIEDVAEMIQDGDIIAATSTVRGLDVAHTGLALWVDGTLHMLHAPLVGEEVQISAVSLADRIQRISGQDGIIVARPLVDPTIER
jgi:hypothetical protein